MYTKIAVIGCWLACICDAASTDLSFFRWGPGHDLNHFENLLFVMFGFWGPWLYLPIEFMVFAMPILCYGLLLGPRVAKITDPIVNLGPEYLLFVFAFSPLIGADLNIVVLLTH